MGAAARRSDGSEREVDMVMVRSVNVRRQCKGSLESGEARTQRGVISSKRAVRAQAASHSDSGAEGRGRRSSWRSYTRGRMPRRDVAGYTHLSLRFAHWLHRGRKGSVISLGNINVVWSCEKQRENANAGLSVL